MELVWQNGQIVMQGQSRNKAETHGPESLHGPSKATKFSEVESLLDDIAPVVPSGGLDLAHDDDMIRWLNGPIDDFCSDLIPGISGPAPARDTLLPIDKRAFGGNFHGCNSTMKAPSSSSKPCLVSGASSDVITSYPSSHSSRGKTVIDGSTGDLMNFSHFLKPAFLAKPNAPIPSSSLLPPRNVAPPSLPVKKTGFFSEEAVRTSGRRAAAERLKEGILVNCTQTTAREYAERVRESTKQSEAASTWRREVADVHERVSEAVVVTSSVGSGNSADRFSYGQTQNSKRKFPEADDSECRSDDLETESIGAKKPSNGSKRSRAAEVHNLSERRRRDRINEKMRALQELIPNCNKADKASMLDEAIEYLKTLQLQVQMMSMGAGLCMPQMMYPHPAAHFPLLMGMGPMGYGSHIFPGPHFPRIPPCPNFPGFGNLGQGIPNLVLPRPPQPQPQPQPPLHRMNGGGGVLPHHACNNTVVAAAASNLNLSSSGRSGVPLNTEDGGGSMKCIISSQQPVTSEGKDEPTKFVQENNKQTTDKVVVHPSNNDCSKLCTSSSPERNKEEAGHS